MDSIEKQLKDAKDALSRLQLQHTDLTNSHATITQERDTLRAANSTLTTERDTARTERDAITTERDTLRAANSTLTTERDQANAQVALIPETVSRRLADHCSAMGISLPKSGVQADVKDLPGGAPAGGQRSELKGRDRLQAGIRAQLVKQGFTKSLSKPVEAANN